jgi:hypothetical protein
MRALKKISFVTFLVVILSLAWVELCHAQGSETQSLSATVTIGPRFTMMPFPIILTFLAVDPNNPTEGKSLIVNCGTNLNSAWSVEMWNTSELTSGTFTIPNANFHWSWVDCTGTGQQNTDSGTVSTTPFTFYECGLDEYITSEVVKNLLTFYVDIPGNQAAGTYTTTLKIRMTDGINEVIRDIGVTAEVNSVLALTSSIEAIEYGTVDPDNYTPPVPFNLYCTTNNNTSWDIQMSAAELNIIATQHTIPNNNWEWGGSGGAAGSQWPAGIVGTFSEIPVTVYIAAPSEHVTDNPVDLWFSTRVFVPSGQTAGHYTSTIVLTMTAY